MPRLRFIGRLREILGSELELEASSPLTLSQILEKLPQEARSLILSEDGGLRVIVLVNEKPAQGLSHVIDPHDVVRFIPIVSGG